MKQARAYKVMRGIAWRYAHIDATLAFDHPDAWAGRPETTTPLVLYTDGTTMVIDYKRVRETRLVPQRPELVVLVCLSYAPTQPTYLAVQAEDWYAWQERVRAIDDPTQLPRLYFDRYNKG